MLITRLKASRGFTLIELMIGLVILAIVLALGVPSYQSWIQNTRLRNTAESILNGLQLARAEAVSRNSAVQFSLDGSSSWTVCLLVGNSCTADSTIQTHPTGEGSSSAVQVTSDAGSVIWFNSLGRSISPVGAAGVVTAINIDIDPAVLEASKSRNLRIAVNGGSVRMCDPNVTSPDTRAC